MRMCTFKADGVWALLRILTSCAGDVQIHLVEINIEVDAEVAEAAGVNGTPTIQMFKVVLPCRPATAVLPTCTFEACVRKPYFDLLLVLFCRTKRG